MCTLFYLIGHYHALGGDPAPFYPNAKGCGRVLDLTCNLIYLPVLRNFTSWLRTTPLRKVMLLGPPPDPPTPIRPLLDPPPYNQPKCKEKTPEESNSCDQYRPALVLHTVHQIDSEK